MAKGKKSKPNPDILIPAGQGSAITLTYDLIDKIVKVVSAGIEVTVAAAMHDVHPLQIREWMIKGIEGRENAGSQRDVCVVLAKRILKALAVAEVRDLSVVDNFAQGRPAQFLMEPAKDQQGNHIILPDGKPLMVPARDKDGNPVKTQEELKPSWHAAAWKLERRTPLRWGRVERVLTDPIQMHVDMIVGAKTDASTMNLTDQEITGDEYSRKLKSVKTAISNYEEVMKYANQKTGPTEHKANGFDQE